MKMTVSDDHVLLNKTCLTLKASRVLIFIILALKSSSITISSLSRNCKASRESLGSLNYGSLITRTYMLVKCEVIVCLYIILLSIIHCDYAFSMETSLNQQLFDEVISETSKFKQS